MILKKLKEKKGAFLFFLFGIGSTIWFLLRVIPKPSRAAYPCMKAAAPFMSGLVIYLIGLATSVFAFRKAKYFLKKPGYGYAAAFTGLAVIATIMVMLSNNPFASAKTYKFAKLENSNEVSGVPRGYWAGRVAWVMDANATNEISNTKSWFESTNQTVVSKMLADGLKRYTEAATVKEAWDCLFKYFNQTHHKGWTGYKTGEKIVVKLNHTNLGSGGHSMSDWMNSTPELVFALLSQLIDSIGVAQADITIGDPYRGFPSVTYNKCHAKYPDVHYIEGSASNGREQTKISKDEVFFTSDDVFRSRLPQAYLDAAYLINMPCLKSHDAAGITIAAKNHQGSVICPDQNATSQYMGNTLHYDYPDNEENQVMGIYRHIVDYMAHSKLGGNTLVYIVDAIWSGRNWNGYVDKFGMPPFNNDYTSSLFISQDAVAIESVGFDFLYYEYENFGEFHQNDDFPLREGVQDYIHQAADPANWPAGIAYDPDTEGHINPVGSLGVHEHWNNATDKKYSVNLTGEKGGIHLVSVPENLVESAPLKYTHETQWAVNVKQNVGNNTFELLPNPVSDFLKVKYTLPQGSKVSIELYTLDGKKAAVLHNAYESAGFRTNTLAIDVEPGLYVCKLTCQNKNSQNTLSAKLVIK